MIASFMQQALANAQLPLVDISGPLDLQPILDSLCELVTVYELVSNVENGSDLHALLGRNIEDSCTWVSNQGLVRMLLLMHNTCTMQGACMCMGYTGAIHADL